MGSDSYLVNHTRKQCIYMGYKAMEWDSEPLKFVFLILKSGWHCDDKIKIKEEVPEGYFCEDESSPPTKE